MKIDDNKKKKLKEVLTTLSTPQELADIREQDKLSNIEKSVKDLDFKKELESVKNDFIEKVNGVEQQIKNIKPTDYTALLEALKEMSGRIGMIKLQERVDRDYSPAYKLMLEKLSSVDSGIRGWKYPQYAYTGLRDKSFAAVNPATDSIGIGSYDAVALSQTSTVDIYTFYTNGLTGTLVATVTINYTDSTKVTVLDIIKTPITIT